MNTLRFHPRKRRFWEDSAIQYMAGEDVTAVEQYGYPGEIPLDPRARAEVGSGDWMCELAVIWTKEGRVMGRGETGRMGPP